jgi:hypothetical protein
MKLLTRGLLAGAAGTAAMTVHQTLRPRGGDPGGEPSWDDAPAPAQVARRLIEGLFRVQVPARRILLLTNAAHWLYGTGWGLVYALAADGADEPLWAGPAFGTAVWAMSYVQLVPMGIYEPPWKYSAAVLADDLGYHLTFGTATALAHRALG